MEWNFDPYKLKGKLIKGGTVVLFVLVLFAALQFGTYEVPRGDHGLSPDFPPKTTLVYDRFCFYHFGKVPYLSGTAPSLLRLNLVLIKRPHTSPSIRAGKVLALPKETFTVTKNGIEVDGQDSSYPGRDHAFTVGTQTLSNGQYLIGWKRGQGKEYSFFLAERKHVVGKVVATY